jgi:hypothetical protein
MPTKPIWVCVDAENDGGALSVFADSAQEAANMVVGSGPYDFADDPVGWDLTKSQIIQAEDQDGATFDVIVYGPFQVATP